VDRQQSKQHCSLKDLARRVRKWKDVGIGAGAYASSSIRKVRRSVSKRKPVYIRPFGKLQNVNELKIEIIGVTLY